jgi:hypothetical protein
MVPNEYVPPRSHTIHNTIATTNVTAGPAAAIQAASRPMETSPSVRASAASAWPASWSASGLYL